MELDEKSRSLLNLLQNALPLVERPFQVLGSRCGLTEDETLARVAELKKAGVLRQISAIFDTRSLGYQSCLVACKAPSGRLELVAEALNRHPGISHNYGREHAFNLWFTLAAPGNSSLQAHLDALLKESGAESMRLLPALRLFKIGMKLDMTTSGGEAEGDAPVYSDAQQKTVVPLSARDIEFVRALQGDLEIRPDPFAPIAQRLQTGPAGVFEWCGEALRLGRMRRLAGILRHRQAGFHANGMGVWTVSAERVDEVGQLFARQPQVTHCYQRPAYPDWPYNVFTMVHARSKEECEALMAQLAAIAGLKDYGILYSTREFKKIRLQYFTGEIEAWEQAHGL